MAQPQRFEARVAQIARHHPQLASLRLEALRPLPRMRPGQFVQLALEPADPSGFWPESRAFSIANAVSDRHTLWLTIGAQGRFTRRLLEQVSAGDHLWAKGPYGDFVIGPTADCHTAVLVAGGTGITPFCAFLDAALQAGRLPLPAVHLHYGARHPGLLVHRPLVEQAQARLRGLRVTYYAETLHDPPAQRSGHAAERMTGRQPSAEPDRAADPYPGAGDTGGAASQAAHDARDAPPDPVAVGPADGLAVGRPDGLVHGRINLADILTRTPDPRGSLFYLSGPGAMLSAFRSGLQRLGHIPAARIRLDAWE